MMGEPYEHAKLKQFFTFNVGHLLTILSIVGGAWYGSTTIVYNVGSELARHEATLTSHDQRLTDNAGAIANVARIEAADEAQRRTWEVQTSGTLSGLQADVGYLRGRMQRGELIPDPAFGSQQH